MLFHNPLVFIKTEYLIYGQYTVYRTVPALLQHRERSCVSIHSVESSDQTIDQQLFSPPPVSALYSWTPAKTSQDEPQAVKAFRAINHFITSCEKSMNGCRLTCSLVTGGSQEKDIACIPVADKEEGAQAGLPFSY